MSRTLLWALLGAQLAFFIGWAALEETRKEGPGFLLETEGVDPRDLFAGQYLTLAYPAARVPAADVEALASDGAPYAVRLEPAGDTVVAGKAWPLRRAADRQAVLSGDWSAHPAAEGWARGTLQNGRVAFGIERYYFSEARAAEVNALRPGQYFVHVRLSRDGRLRIQDLVHW